MPKKKIASKEERYKRIKKGVDKAKKGTFSLKTKEMAKKAKGKGSRTTAQDRKEQARKLAGKKKKK